jgi:hypothetical protein
LPEAESKARQLPLVVLGARRQEQTRRERPSRRRWPDRAHPGDVRPSTGSSPPGRSRSPLRRWGKCNRRSREKKQANKRRAERRDGAAPANKHMRVYVLPVATTSHRSIRDRRALRGHRQRASPPAGEAFTREHPRREHYEHDSATSTRRRARRQVGGKPQIRRSHRDNRHRHASERKGLGHERSWPAGRSGHRRRTASKPRPGSHDRPRRAASVIRPSTPPRGHRHPVAPADPRVRRR